jgi:hypothetical protein
MAIPINEPAFRQAARPTRYGHQLKLRNRDYRSVRMADHPPFFPSPFSQSKNSVSLVSTETFRQAMSDLLKQPRFARMGVD